MAKDRYNATMSVVGSLKDTLIYLVIANDIRAFSASKEFPKYEKKKKKKTV